MYTSNVKETMKQTPENNDTNQRNGIVYNFHKLQVASTIVHGKIHCNNIYRKTTIYNISFTRSYTFHLSTTQSVCDNQERTTASVANFFFLQ
jgi:hypothetical protein